VERYFITSRADSGSSCKPLRPIIRRIENSQPSGVARRHEMRDIRPLSSVLWQGEQDLRTASLGMGVPESISSCSFSEGVFAAPARVFSFCCAGDTEQQTASETAQTHSTLMVKPLYAGPDRDIKARS